MCGIVGFVGFRDDDLIHRMNDSQVHRGPDDGGYFHCPQGQVTLAMRRLSILDLSGGRQPMTDRSEQICIVYNGEIFNSAELRLRLVEHGYLFKTDHSDTEVLLYMYDKYGPDMLQYLNGMFAFVLYDKKNKKLFGARDRFGIKPLNYAFRDRKFAFASEVKSLRVVPWVSDDLSFQSIYHYLSFQCVPGPQSVFQDVQKLPAAHYFELSLENSRLVVKKYWQPNFTANQNSLAQKDLSGFVRSELQDAVTRWMMSDVPVGFSLSGGIDSSATVGLISAAKKYPRLKTYSLGFEGAPELDETHLARLVSERWGTDHSEIKIKPIDLLKDLDSMLYHLDEPYAGGLPSWFVFKRMAKDVKVGVTGTGGDEVFGNYGKWDAFKNPVRGLKILRLGLRRGASAGDFIHFPHGSMYSSYFRDHIKKSEIVGDCFPNHLQASEELIERLWKESPSRDARNRVPFVDLRIQLPEEFLHMTDRFSMAHSLEARTPFLDHVFVEKMFSIPARLRTKRKNLKYLLINAVKDILPPELLGEKKRGFVLPMTEWTRGALKNHVEEFLGETYLRRQGLFKPSIYSLLVKPHLNGELDKTWEVWTLLMFQLWYEKSILHSTVSV